MSFCWQSEPCLLECESRSEPGAACRQDELALCSHPCTPPCDVPHLLDAGWAVTAAAAGCSVFPTGCKALLRCGWQQCGRDELFHCFAVPANISLICHFAHLQQSWEEDDAVLIAKVLGCCVVLSSGLSLLCTSRPAGWCPCPTAAHSHTHSHVCLHLACAEHRLCACLQLAEAVSDRKQSTHMKIVCLQRGASHPCQNLHPSLIFQRGCCGWWLSV